MPLYFFYTMVQKSQKWPKTQIKGGGPALSLRRVRSLVLVRWVEGEKKKLRSLYGALRALGAGFG